MHQICSSFTDPLTHVARVLLPFTETEQYKFRRGSSTSLLGSIILYLQGYPAIAPV